MTQNWIAVASANHVARGREGGFMQVGHGKRGPLRRLKTGDRVAYYSPALVLGEPAPCRCFTAFPSPVAQPFYESKMPMARRFKTCRFT